MQLSNSPFVKRYDRDNKAQDNVLNSGTSYSLIDKKSHHN